MRGDVAGPTPDTVVAKLREISAQPAAEHPDDSTSRTTVGE
jgi:hypothetical protein